MKIKRLTLYTDLIEERKHFFGSVLGLPINQYENDSFWVQVGWTQFCFQRSQEHYLYHYCFLIPCNKLQEVLKWFSAKVDIVTMENNQNIVFFDTWNAHSFYFYDGAGNIAECIVRHDLQNHSEKPFSSTDLLCVNEIGLGTNDITKTDLQLGNAFGTHLWKGDKDRFAAHGGQDGLFLLPNYQVKEIWFPTEIPIKPNPVSGTVEHEGKSNNFNFINGELNS